jgi:hypothetical protein
MDESNDRATTLAKKIEKIKVAKWDKPKKKYLKKNTAALSFLLLQMRRSRISTII